MDMDQSTEQNKTGSPEFDLEALLKGLSDESVPEGMPIMGTGSSFEEALVNLVKQMHYEIKPDEIPEMGDDETIAHYLKQEVRETIGFSLVRLGRQIEKTINKRALSIFQHPTDDENRLIIGFGDGSAYQVILEETTLEAMNDLAEKAGVPTNEENNK